MGTQVVSGTNYFFSFADGSEVTVWVQPWTDKYEITSPQALFVTEPADVNPEPVHAELAEVHFTKADLLAEFDKVDEDETGFCPRLDLRKHLEENLLPNCPSIESLVDMLKSMDVMILERDDFEDGLDKWAAHIGRSWPH